MLQDDALWQDFDITESALSAADKEVVQLAVAKHIIWCATRSGRLLLKYVACLSSPGCAALLLTSQDWEL